MIREYYALESEKDERFDAGVVDNPQDIEEKEDGLYEIVLRDGEEELKVNYEVTSDGDIEYELPEEADDEKAERFKRKIEEAGLTVGQLYKMKKEIKEEKSDLQRKLAERDAEIEKLRLEIQRIKNERQDGMTNEEAKLYFGVDTVEDVKDMMELDYPRWAKLNAKYLASFVTLDKEQNTKQSDVKYVRKKAPTVVNAVGGGQNKPNNTSDPFYYLKKHITGG